MKTNPRKKMATSKTTKLKPKEFLLVLGALAAYFFYMKSKDMLLNYPSWLSFSLFLSILIIAIGVKGKYLLNSQPKNNKIDQLIYWGFSIIKFSVFSWFITGISLIPFNYYNIYQSKEQPIERVECEITGVSTFSKNRKVFYKLYNVTNVTYGYKPIMEEIKEGKRYRDYHFIAYVRKGLFNSYLIEDWDIQKNI